MGVGPLMCYAQGMCLLAIAVEPHPSLRLVVAANRDEAHDRPALPAHHWDDVLGAMGGRDLRGGGTWLGVRRGFRFAALTNVRDPAARREGRSRGALPFGFLQSVEVAQTYLHELERAAYPAFNMVVADSSGVFYGNELSAEAVRLGPGFHSLSNGRYGDAWPKVVRVREAMKPAIMASGDIDSDALFEMLRDEQQAPDDELPRTGVPIEIERRLSSPFVRGDTYGTRCSTVVVVDGAGRITLSERSFAAGGAPAGPPVELVLEP